MMIIDHTTLTHTAHLEVSGIGMAERGAESGSSSSQLMWGTDSAWKGCGWGESSELGGGAVSGGNAVSCEGD